MFISAAINEREAAHTVDLQWVGHIPQQCGTDAFATARRVRLAMDALITPRKATLSKVMTSIVQKRFGAIVALNVLN